MIFVYGRGSVLTEGIQLARCKIAEGLELPLELVYAHIELKGGTITPSFSLDEKAEVGARSQDDLVEVMRECYGYARRLMTERLRGVSERRFSKEEAGSQAGEEEGH